MDLSYLGFDDLREAVHLCLLPHLEHFQAILSHIPRIAPFPSWNDEGTSHRPLASSQGCLRLSVFFLRLFSLCSHWVHVVNLSACFTDVCLLPLLLDPPLHLSQGFLFSNFHFVLPWTSCWLRGCFPGCPESCDCSLACTA